MYESPDWTISILSIILNIIILICFFYLGANVSKIKNVLTQKFTPTNYLVEYYKQLAIGNNEKALEAIREHTWIEFKKIRGGYSKARFPELYNQLKANNEERYKEIGADFPAEPNWDNIF